MNSETTLPHSKIKEASSFVPDDTLGAKSANIVVSTLSRNRLLMPILGLLVTLLLFAATTFIGFFWPVQAPVVFIMQLLLLICGLFLLAYTVYRIRQQMLKPIAGLRNWSQRIRAGDLNTHIDLPPRGEFASLIQDINGLTDELHILTEECVTKPLISLTSRAHSRSCMTLPPASARLEALMNCWNSSLIPS
jgi:methyl-accepting chemotaxis protein